ncbi:MAG: AAA family ATPase [Pyrinomonadaceae bacterium]
MAGVVVGVIGKIKSGKSSLSRSLSENLNWPYVSFGDEVRMITRRRGLNPSRGALQEIGEELVAKSAKEFCEAVLAQAEWQPGQFLVVDGIRHLKIVEILRDLVRPSVLRLVYVKTADHLREGRLEDEITDRQELARIEHHSTEVQVGTILSSLADRVVDGSKPLNSLTIEIITWLDEESINLRL